MSYEEQIKTLSENVETSRKMLRRAQNNHGEAIGELQAAKDAVLEFLRQAAPELASRFETAQSSFDSSFETVETVKKIEKQATDALRDAIQQVASADFLEGKDVFGSGRYHEHVKVTKKFQVILPENAYEFGAAMSWLVEQGKRENIDLKIHGDTAWFKSVKLHPTIKTAEIPDAKVDSINTWCPSPDA